MPKITQIKIYYADNTLDTLDYQKDGSVKRTEWRTLSVK